MDGLDLFLMRYDAVHGGFVDELFSDITEGQLRARPHGVNSVAWLIWHASRLQDAAVSRFVGDRPQAFDEGHWGPRLGVERRDCGPGMTAAEVNQLSAAVDLAALREYHRAVADRTRAIATALAPAAWSEVVPPDLIRRVVTDERLLVDAGRWVGEFWAEGRTRGWYLLQVGLLHPYGHWFDAMVTRGLLGVGRG